MRIGSMVVLAALGACTSGTTTFQTMVRPGVGAPVTRLVVFESVESPFFDHELHRGFVIGLERRLASCGVQAHVERIEPLELDPAQHVAQAVTAAGANATLEITAAGGKRTSQGDSSSDVLQFGLKMVDTASNEARWKGTASLGLSQSWRTDRSGSGAAFATSIVTRLRDDGVLAHCPPGATSWPDLDLPDPPKSRPPAAPHFTSRLEVAPAAPPHRVLLYEELLAPPVGRELHEGFIGELGRRLYACGLLTRFRSSIDDATTDALVEAARAFEADTIFLIRRRGGNIRTGEPGDSDVIMDLRLIELASAKLLWRGLERLDIRVNLSAAGSTEAGKRVAVELVSRLRDDGVLAACPR